MFRLTSRGFEDAQGALVRYTRGCAAVGQLRLKLQTGVQYAWGIETGYHRTGRLARRAGGAFYMRDSWRDTEPEVTRELARAIPQGDAGVLAVQHMLGPRWLMRAKARTPVKTGTLQGSIEIAYR